MINRILTVGGLTLLSRVTGFARDIVMAAVLGAGPDRGRVLRRVPAAQPFPRDLRRGRVQRRLRAGLCAHPHARRGRGRQAVRRPHLHAAVREPDRAARARARLHARGDPACSRRASPTTRGRFALAVDLTRITFPYLLLMTLVTLLSGILNSIGRFAAAAAAPILLNLTMMVALLLAAFFPTAGHAAAWGVLVAGVLEVLLVGGDALRDDVLTAFRRPRWDDDVKRFFKALGAGDRRLGRRAARAVRRHHHRELARGRRALGALLRRPALPVARRRHRHRGRHRAAARDGAPDRGRRRGRRARRAGRARSTFTLLLAVPCVAAFLVVPDLIMRALFMRGEIHRRGRARRRDDARGLYDRADPVRADAQRHRRRSWRAATPRRR